MSRGKDSFERFYMNKVSLGEGCGCAEMIVTAHELDRKAGEDRRVRLSGPGYLGRIWARIFKRA